MDELTIRRMLKESKKELSVLKNKYESSPTKQLKFDLNIKVVEVGLLNVKLRNIKKRGTYS